MMKILLIKKAPFILDYIENAKEDRILLVQEDCCLKPRFF